MCQFKSSKWKKARKGKALEKQKKSDNAAALEDQDAPHMCKDEGKEQPDQAQHTEQAGQASLELYWTA